MSLTLPYLWLFNKVLRVLCSQVHWRWQLITVQRDVIGRFSNVVLEAYTSSIDITWALWMRKTDLGGEQRFDREWWFPRIHLEVELETGIVRETREDRERDDTLWPWLSLNGEALNILCVHVEWSIWARMRHVNRIVTRRRSILLCPCWVLNWLERTGSCSRMLPLCRPKTHESLPAPIFQPKNKPSGRMLFWLTVVVSTKPPWLWPVREDHQVNYSTKIDNTLWPRLTLDILRYYSNSNADRRVKDIWFTLDRLLLDWEALNVLCVRIEWSI